MVHKFQKRDLQPMIDRLARAGVPKDEIGRQIEAFSNAVQCELRRRGDFNPKGAA